MSVSYEPVSMTAQPTREAAYLSNLLADKQQYQAEADFDGQRDDLLGLPRYSL